ncbi:hypothetical protein, partial [Anaplasma bovis]|uniref:hypothetical protein n=1 Tax=Anaplasma bovis TaxID=186733 RepID=UPI002FF38A0D
MLGNDVPRPGGFLYRFTCTSRTEHRRGVSYGDFIGLPPVARPLIYLDVVPSCSLHAWCENDRGSVSKKGIASVRRGKSVDSEKFLRLASGFSSVSWTIGSSYVEKGALSKSADSSSLRTKAKKRTSCKKSKNSASKKNVVTSVRRGKSVDSEKFLRLASG